MKESISYTFLLNIVILFIVVCATIIAGIMSYYRAFRASRIIAESIEKYEGFNCLSKEEIATKLQTISYNTPFKVQCKKDDGKCEAQEDLGYKVIANNLDFDTNDTSTDSPHIGTKLIYGEQMNSVYYCTGKTGSNGASTSDQKCITNKHYQFGIYTYMYADIPVISKLLRIPLYTKTAVLYDLRNYHILKRSNGYTTIVDTSSVFDNLYIKKYETIDGKTGTFIKDSYLGKKIIYGSSETTTEETAMFILKQAIYDHVAFLSKPGNSDRKTNLEYMFMNITNDTGTNYRTRAIAERIEKNRRITTALASTIWNTGVDGVNSIGVSLRRECGFKIDYKDIN